MTLVTGSPEALKHSAHLSSDAGFSLVEVLMSVFIMALATSVIILTRPPPPDAMSVEVEQFQDMLEATTDKAILTGAPTGIRLSAEGYSQLVWREGEWVNISNQVVKLPDGASLEILQRGEDQTGPDIEMSPLGDVSPVQVNLAMRGRYLLLSIDAEGSITRSDGGG